MNEDFSLFSGIFKDAQAIVTTMLDKATEAQLAKWDQPWYKKHMTTNPDGRTKGEFDVILEELHAAPAASTINEFSERPIRSFDGFGKAKVEMFSIGHTYKLEAEDLRAIAEYARIWSSDQKKVLQYIVNKLMNVRQRAIEGIQNSHDLKVLTALSNDGVYTYTAQNDPGSPFIGQTVNFGWDAAHSGTAQTAWTQANKATINILEDLMAMKQEFLVAPEKMYLREELVHYMLGTDKIRLFINGRDNASRPVSITQLKSLFAEYELPELEIVHRKIRVDSNGGKDQNLIQPWNQKKILFANSSLGSIERKITDAELGIKSPGVDYSYHEGIELTNWVQGIKEGGNYTEFTSAGVCATPVFPGIKNMWSLDTQFNANA